MLYNTKTNKTKNATQYALDNTEVELVSNHVRGPRGSMS